MVMLLNNYRGTVIFKASIYFCLNVSLTDLWRENWHQFSCVRLLCSLQYVFQNESNMQSLKYTSKHCCTFFHEWWHNVMVIVKIVALVECAERKECFLYFWCDYRPNYSYPILFDFYSHVKPNITTLFSVLKQKVTLNALTVCDWWLVVIWGSQSWQ